MMNSTQSSTSTSTAGMTPVQIQAAAILELRRRRGEYVPREHRYQQYRDDPVGFGVDVLGDYYPPDIARMMESVRDNRVTIARSGNSVGKTFAAARLAIWFYLMWDDAKVYTAAAPPERNLRRLLWGEISAAVNKKPELFTGHHSRVMLIHRPIIPPATEPTSFITGLTIPATGTPEQREARFSGKHGPHQLFIMDEADAIPDECLTGTESCMSGSHERLIALINPRMRAGRIWEMEDQQEANVVELSALRHPNVIRGEDRVPGAVSREVTVRRINKWTRPLAPGEPVKDSHFKVPDFLVGTTAKMDRGNEYYPPLAAGYREIESPEFYYMTLGIYSPYAVNQLISKTWVDAARSRWDAYVAVNGKVPPSGVSAILGQDVAEFGPDSNVACIRHGGWVAPFIIWNGMDTDAVADEAYLIYKEHGCTKAFIDGTGWGSNVAPKMRRQGASAEGIKVGMSPTSKVEEGEFDQLKDQLYWAVREWLRTDTGAMLPPDSLLVSELLAATYSHTRRHRRIKVSDKEAMRAKLRRSPDRFDALALTFAGDMTGGGWSVGTVRLATRR